MKKYLRFLLLLPLLLPLMMSSQTAGTQLEVTWDTANGPFCTATVLADCISGANIYSGTTFIVNVPASAFAVSAGMVNKATITIPAVPNKKFGNIPFTAKMKAVAWDNTQLESDDSVLITVVRRPIPPGLAVR